jgi:hypothetical protein
MTAFVLVHRNTGMPLRGYRVGSADAMEIAMANQRLAACASAFRFVPDLHAARDLITPDADAVC